MDNVKKFPSGDSDDFIDFSYGAAQPVDWEEWSTFRDKLTFETEIDRVNHPSHYTKGKVEAIEIIESAIEDAPCVKAGMLQAQALKYLLRLWLKDNPAEDARKAQWYLNRLVDSLNCESR